MPAADAPCVCDCGGECDACILVCRPCRECSCACVHRLFATLMAAVVRAHPEMSDELFMRVGRRWAALAEAATLRTVERRGKAV